MEEISNNYYYRGGLSTCLILDYCEFHDHMSVEPKRCILNWSKGGTGIFIPVTMSQIRGYATPNQIHLLFGISVKKCAKTTQNKASKGLIWFGNNLVMIQGVPWYV